MTLRGLPVEIRARDGLRGGLVLASEVVGLAEDDGAGVVLMLASGRDLRVVGTVDGFAVLLGWTGGLAVRTRVAAPEADAVPLTRQGGRAA